MVETIWVRPSGYGNFLVFEDREVLKANFEALFNIDAPEQFLNQVDESELETELYDEKDLGKYDTAKIEKDGDEEEIEFKLVKMSEADLEEIGEFTGW